MTAASVYVWFINHAEDLVQQFIYNESNGTVDLKIGKVRYNHERQLLTLIKTRFITPGNENTRYNITAEKFILKVGTLRSILNGGKLQVDSILCESPEVEVVKLRPEPNRDFSIPEEMSKVYKILGRSLRNLTIRQFRLSNGVFSIRRQYQQASKPVRMDRINLLVDEIHADAHNDDSSRFLFTDRIILESTNQDILLADGYHGLQFKKFYLNTKNRIIQLDSCLVFGNKRDTAYGEFRVFFERLRLTNTDLNSLAKKDIIVTDSVLCTRPDIQFRFELKDNPGSYQSIKKRLNKDSVERAFKELVGNLQLGYIDVEEAGIDITAMRQGEVSRYTSERSNFTIHDVRIIQSPEIPIRIGRFDFEIMDYLGYSTDSLYAIRFDSIQLMDDKLSLSHFSIRATKRNQNAEWREVKMKAFELEDIYWTELIFKNRLRARNARLVNPGVELNLQGQVKGKAKPKGSLFLALASFRKYVEMDNLFLKDASVTIRSGNGSVLKMDGFNTGIDVNKLLGSGDATDLINSIQAFDFARGTLSNNAENILLTSGRYDGNSQHLQLGKATYTNKRNPIVITAEALTLTEAERTPDNQFKATDLSWKKADILIQKRSQPRRQPSTEKPLLIGWNRTFGQDTRLVIETGETSLRTNMRSLQTGPVLIPTNGKPRISNLDLEGNALILRQSDFMTSIGSYQIIDEKTSRFSKIHLEIPAGKKLVTADIPRLDMIPDLESFIDNKPSLSKIRIYDPLIRFTENPGLKPDNASSGIPPFTLGELQLTGVVLEGIQELLPEEMNVLFRIPTLKVTNIRSSGQALSFGRMDGDLKELSIKKTDMQIGAPSPEPATFTLSNFSLNPNKTTNGRSWKFWLDSLAIPRINTVLHNGAPERTSYLNTTAFRVGGLEFRSDNTGSMLALTENNPALFLAANHINYHNPYQTIDFTTVNFHQKNKRLTAESFNIRPLLDKDSFTRSLTYQKQYLKAGSGRIVMDGVDLEKYLRDDIVQAKKVDIKDPVLYIFKDRTLPVKSGTIKKLPTVQIKNINQAIRFDTVRLHEGSIRYEEINDLTGKPGRVDFSRTEARITNFRTSDFNENDSMDLTMRSAMLDTAEIRLRFRESYTDSLNGFLMSLQIGRFSLPALNSVLEPIASARIRSGYLDTLTMKAVGNEYTAWGKMQMYYRDLKVQFLNKEDYEKKTAFTRLVNFAANAIVRKGNRKKTGTVYTERNREKGFVNYWMRIALSGMLTNAGIRGNNKQDRNYHKEIRKKQIPEIPDFELD